MNEYVDAPVSPKSTDSFPNRKALKQTARHLRLIVSNPGLLSPSQPDSATEAGHIPFTVEIKATTPGHYIMNVQDVANRVDCKLPLEIRLAQEEEEPSTVICQFPSIDFQKLSKFIWEDNTLYGVLAIRFQMKVLEQLMLFCAEHIADTLVLVMEPEQVEEFEIYQNWVIKQKRISTSSGKKVQMTLSVEYEQYDAWVDFMEDTKLKFSQTLWSDQRSNQPLKSI